LRKRFTCDEKSLNKFQTIYLGVEDDISSVVDYLARAESLNVVFVIPKNAEIFNSIINFRLLKREAENLGKNISIITADRTGRYLAKRADILLADELSGIESLLEEEKKEKIIRERKVRAEVIPEPIKEAHDVQGRPRTSMMDIVAPEAKAEPVRLKKEILAEPEDLERSTIEEKVDDFYLKSRRADKKEKKQTEQEELDKESFFEEAPPADLQAGSWQPYLKEEEDAVADFEDKEQYSASDFQYAPAQRLPYADDFSFGSPTEEFKPMGEIKRGRYFRIFSGSKIFKKTTWIFLATGLVVAAVAGYFIFPSATIILTPKKETISFSATITADKNMNKVDYSLKKIPTQLVRVEKTETKEFSATGAGGSGSKAKGIITVYNAYSSASQTLVATTRFVSASTGKLFRTTQTITVPGAKTENGQIVPSSIDVEVMADVGGTEYNIGPSDFSIPGFAGSPKYEKFYGKSKETMSGGSSGGENSISSGDLDNARKTMLAEFSAEQKNILNGQIADNMKAFQEAIKEEEPEITFSLPVGTATKKFTATIKFRSVALVFEEAQMSDLADRLISAQLMDKRRAVENTRQIAYDKIQVNFERGQIFFTAKFSQNAVWKIDISDLKEKILEKNEEEIRKTLGQMPAIANAKISFWPFWVKKMPSQVDKIKVTIDEIDK
jgi:hypothetical protein